ncbi:unnamed protein product [Gordionus sp. m RMFG-2023]|uniref:uncharacterized protein LOC135928965 isoform X1 n=1 Tax=Gordionus sp. m RMFG-2023 TaxID=3053472 RepID=UPI0030DE3A3B
MEFWNQFFINAGFENDTANDLSILFNNHHLTKQMLPSITKEHLIDMGIKTIGDIILIQNQAKEIQERENNPYKIQQRKDGIKLSSENILNYKKQEIYKKLDENMDVEQVPVLPEKSILLSSTNDRNNPTLKTQSNTKLQSQILPSIQSNSVINQSINESITKVATSLPIAKLVGTITIPKKETNNQSQKGQSKKVQFQRRELSGANKKISTIAAISPLISKTSSRTVSQGIFANSKPRPSQGIRNRLGTLPSNNDLINTDSGPNNFNLTMSAERNGLRRVTQKTSFKRTILNSTIPSSKKQSLFGVMNYDNETNGRKVAFADYGKTRSNENYSDRLSRRLPLRNSGRVHDLPITPHSSVFNRLGQKSAKERLGII